MHKVQFFFAFVMQSLGINCFFDSFNSQTSQQSVFESPIFKPSTDSDCRFKLKNVMSHSSWYICKLLTLKQFSLEQGKLFHIYNTISTSKTNEYLLKTSLSFSLKEISTPASLNFETKSKIV